MKINKDPWTIKGKDAKRLIKNMKRNEKGALTEKEMVLLQLDNILEEAKADKMLKEREETKIPVLHIEICRSHYVKGRFNYIEGDIIGSIGMINVSMSEILDEIKSRMKGLKT
jgi:hypothetical protein